MERIEFRRVSSILEYREVIEPSDVYSKFGIEHKEEPSYGSWRPMTGSKMLTMTADELRQIANLIG